MSKPENSTHTAGITADTLLGITFIVLKLTHVIDWSWWWVLTPFWVPLAIAVIGAIMITILTR